MKKRSHTSGVHAYGSNGHGNGVADGNGGGKLLKSQAKVLAKKDANGVRKSCKNKNVKSHHNGNQIQANLFSQQYQFFPTHVSPKSKPKSQPQPPSNSHSSYKKSSKKIQDYIMINGNIYKADTKTERLEVNHFVTKMKRQADMREFFKKEKKGNGQFSESQKFGVAMGIGMGNQFIKKNYNGNENGYEYYNGESKEESRLYSRQSNDGSCVSYSTSKQKQRQKQKQFIKQKQSNIFKQNEKELNIEALVKTLPLQQKLSLMKQLQKQFSNNPESQTQPIPSASSLPPLPPIKNELTQPPLSIPSTSPSMSSPPNYTLLSSKLSTLENELSLKRQNQIQKINKLFDEGQLTASQRRNKINGVDKVKQRKLKIISCARSLFKMLLYGGLDGRVGDKRQREDRGEMEEKDKEGVLGVDCIQDAMKQLDSSFSDIQLINSQQNINTNNQNNNQISLSHSQNISLTFSEQSSKPQTHIASQTYQQKNPILFSNSLSLNLNLNGNAKDNRKYQSKNNNNKDLLEQEEDQGKDKGQMVKKQVKDSSYVNEDNEYVIDFQNQSGSRRKNNLNNNHSAQKNSDKKSLNQQPLLITPDKSSDKNDRQLFFQRQSQPSSTSASSLSINLPSLSLPSSSPPFSNPSASPSTESTFQCTQPLRKLNIPLLLTKQKIQQMQWERKAKTIQKMKNQIQKKISFQMGQLEIQEDGQGDGYEKQKEKDKEKQVNGKKKEVHFTTLADINSYIVCLYQFVIKKDLKYTVEKLNMAYGKPILDKLFLLQQIGEIDNLQYETVLNQSHFNGFNMEMALTIRKFGQFQKIHNKAVFDSFNMHLNAYRPYYDLDGQVYPWFISQKGLTFYQINDQNIQQVFQKTKIKVLEQSSTLCGLLPLTMDPNQCPQLIKQKNNEHFIKQEKLEIIQNYGKWNLKILDYDTMVRLLIAEEVLIREIVAVCGDLRGIGG